MGALLGLLLGAGLLLIWRSGSRAPQRGTGTTPGWLVQRTDLLRQAGIDRVGSGQSLAAQVLCAGLAFVLVVLITSTVTVAACLPRSDSPYIR